jgi:hypothetical protein
MPFMDAVTLGPPLLLLLLWLTPLLLLLAALWLELTEEGAAALLWIMLDDLVGGLRFFPIVFANERLAYIELLDYWAGCNA